MTILEKFGLTVQDFGTKGTGPRPSLKEQTSASTEGTEPQPFSEDILQNFRSRLQLLSGADSASFRSRL